MHGFFRVLCDKRQQRVEVMIISGLQGGDIALALRAGIAQTLRVPTKTAHAEDASREAPPSGGSGGSVSFLSYWINNAMISAKKGEDRTVR